MMDLAQLRKLRNSSTDLSKLTKAVESAQGQSKSEDDRYWKLEADKAGNGSAVIRFLPQRDDDELPWIRFFHHSFKGPTGKWYIERSLSTFGEDDPVGNLNRSLWNSGTEANKKKASAQKRRLSFVANILVVKDPANPQNEGQVKLFKFGKKIFDMISEKLNPSFQDDEPVDVFNPFFGSNFKLRLAKVEGYPNYDKSTWDNSSEMFGGDEDKILEALNARHSLKEVNDRKHFKTFDELKKRLDLVLDTKGVVMPTAEAEEVPWDEEETVKPAAKVQKAKPAPVKVEDEEDDEISSYFHRIAEA